MTKSTDAKHSVGIMARLASNQEGNIIAIFAVAIIPAIALVGGAVGIYNPEQLPQSDKAMCRWDANH